MASATRKGFRRQHTGLSMVLLIWFFLIMGLSLNQSFVPLHGEPPLNILISAGIAIGSFLLAYRILPPFRTYILKLDMRFLIMLHSWRMLGMGFVMLYLYDQLPPLFALLAGFGDAVTAIAAVLLAYALFVNQQGVSRKWVWRWNTFGLLDFIIAVTIGILTQTDALLFAANGVSSDLMTVFPFVLIPAFLVQVFTITHIIIYLQLKNNNQSNLTPDNVTK